MIKKPAIFGFYGYSNSGKTTLLVRLITDLRNQGFNVAAIKQSDQKVSLDTPGKDTYLFSSAGSNPVVLKAESETSIIIHANIDIKKIIEIISIIEDIDVILIESARDANIPKIRLGNKVLRENTIWTYDDNYDALIQRILSEVRNVQSNAKS